MHRAVAESPYKIYGIPLNMASAQVPSPFLLSSFSVSPTLVANKFPFFVLPYLGDFKPHDP
jgi:hypothetical protein